MIGKVSDKFNLSRADYLEYHKNVLDSIDIKGESNSAKVIGVVRCLLLIIGADPEAKCLVFSEHVIVLELINSLLRENQVNYIFIKDNSSLQKNIERFKKNSSMNVLLMPYSFGANGLNVVE